MLSSPWVLVTAMVLFAAQAAWVALAASPVIYDEHYHVAAIDAFSRRWTPFIDQTVADGPLGDAERYGSYLYHYMMSFPWRLTGAAGLSPEHRMLVIRLITVVIVTGALYAWWSFFHEVGASPAVANVAVGIVSATPLIVFLGGFVNYDNALFLVVPFFLRSAARLAMAERLLVSEWLRFIIIAGVGCLTKYTFVPLVPLVALVVLIQQVRVVRRGRTEELQGYISAPRDRLWWGRLALIGGAILSVCLVAERYLMNVVRYGSVVPDCLAVHELDLCQMHPPWARNMELDAAFEDRPGTMNGAFSFLTGHWVPIMLKNMTWYGTVSGDGIVQSRGPAITGVILYLAIPALLGVLVLAGGYLLRSRAIRMVVGTSVLYVIVLFALNYSDFLRMGVAIGIAGRYVLILLPIVIGLACIGAARLLGGESPPPASRATKVVLLGIVLLLCTQGGGATSFFWSVDEAWLKHPEGRSGQVTMLMHSVVERLIVPDSAVVDPRFAG
ncbi:glycosyltransferase family 39 protein [Sanguibacter suaedae]|uniref:Glycosyltransferase family 39 protein n=1 Tax=Sanguibacter suaedae TaxID=2795737 RepID=A0A934I7V6_9MICO|nr:glycosyltransferase family 39 protein [Sanguibacter suaedae]MBI9114767.1 glycosyltransferase family 39 protein [Sanguibacter suaedae]